MSASVNAVKAALANVAKAKKAARPVAGTGNAYIRFSNAKRASVTGTTTEKMKALGAMWKSASDAEKAPFLAQAAAAKAAAAKAPAPAPPAYPLSITLKSEADLDKLVQKVSDAAIKGWLAEVACHAAGSEEAKIKTKGGVVSVLVREGKKPIEMRYRAPPSLTKA